MAIRSTNIVNLIDSIIDSIRETSSITSITHSGTTYTIHTSDTKNLRVKDYVKISGNNYKILTLTTNNSFTVNSSIAIVGTSWKALAPFYFYGTPIHIANTLDKIKDYAEKYPVIVLFETMPADVDDDENSTIERTVALEMYFMDEANFIDWDMADYYTNVINRMQSLVDDFIEACEDSKSIGVFLTHKETNHSKWNLVRLDTGKNVFNAELSGIQLNINLPIKRNLEC